MEAVPPTVEALQEALQLSREIIGNVELQNIPLSNIALKALRVARLLNDLDHQTIFEYEVSGYPSGPKGIPGEAWRLAGLAGRQYQEEKGTVAYTQAISALEEGIRTAELRLQAARDPDISLSSANPNQFLIAPQGNAHERNSLQRFVSDALSRLAARRSFIYRYALGTYYDLKFSGIASDVFARIRERTDSMIGLLVPESLKRLSAVHDNLRSENSENWSNAVHSCRRILKDLADILFPARDSPRSSPDGRSINLGPENYINRLVCFAEDQASSMRFQEIVGSHLQFLGDRLDSIFKVAQKGSHAHIISREEADRYVIYTYMLVGDLLSLRVPTVAAEASVATLVHQVDTELSDQD